MRKEELRKLQFLFVFVSFISVFYCSFTVNIGTNSGEPAL